LEPGRVWNGKTGGRVGRLDYPEKKNSPSLEESTRNQLNHIHMTTYRAESRKSHDGGRLVRAYKKFAAM